MIGLMKRKSANTIASAVLVSKSSLLLLSLLLISGCANYASRVREARNYFEWEQYDLASAKLKELAERKDNDELLYWMDLGLVQHTAGQYAEAIESFLKASKIGDSSDYTSVVTEAATVALNDNVKAYPGEHFEKLLVNMYLAIDYTLLGKYEDALVECRQVNRKLEKMINEGGFPYQQNAFAKYLAASLFEAEREYNDAFVDYRQLYKWDGAIPYLSTGLLRMADRMKDLQALENYKKIFPQDKDYKLDKGEGEVILLLEQGKAPIKEPSPQFRLAPMFVSRPYSSDYGVLHLAGSEKVQAQSATLFDIEATAIRELEHKLGLILAKKIGGVVAKEVLSNAIAESTKSEALGDIIRIILHLTDQADLRSWSTLPARLQLARLKLPAGRHDLALDMVSRYGGKTPAVKIWKDFEVKAGRISFINYRFKD